MHQVLPGSRETRDWGSFTPVVVYLSSKTRKTFPYYVPQHVPKVLKGTEKKYESYDPFGSYAKVRIAHK